MISYQQLGISFGHWKFMAIFKIKEWNNFLTQRKKKMQTLSAQQSFNLLTHASVILEQNCVTDSELITAQGLLIDAGCGSLANLCAPQNPTPIVELREKVQAELVQLSYYLND